MRNDEEISHVRHGHAKDHHAGICAVGLYRSKKPTRAEVLPVQREAL